MRPFWLISVIGQLPLSDVSEMREFQRTVGLSTMSLNTVAIFAAIVPPERIVEDLKEYSIDLKKF